MIFCGPVDERGRLDVDVRAQIADHIRHFAGHTVEVKVHAYRPGTRKRTLKQNAYWHAEPFLKLAQAWGESVDRAKLICMGQFWGWEPCKVTGFMLPVKSHTSDMTVEEGTVFLDWLIPWALQEHGVVIELPEEWAATKQQVA